MKPFHIIIDWTAWTAYPGQARVEVTLHVQGQEPLVLTRTAEPVLAAAYVRRWFEGRGLAFTCNINDAQRRNATNLVFWPKVKPGLDNLVTEAQGR